MIREYLAEHGGAPYKAPARTAHLAPSAAPTPRDMRVAEVVREACVESCDDQRYDASRYDCGRALLALDLAAVVAKALAQSEREDMAREVATLRARVAELEDDFAKRQASHCCPTWNDQMEDCDCDERMGGHIARWQEAEARSRGCASPRRGCGRRWNILLTA